MSECPLKSVSVTGVVNNFVAQVVVSQTYRNETDDAVDCTFLVPFGAYSDLGTVTDWLVERDGSETVPGVVLHKEGNAMFRAATSNLMDRIRTSIREPTFVCSVGNLLPGEDLSVKFSFLAPLDSTPDGFFRVVVPLNFGSAQHPIEVEISLTVTTDCADIRFVESPTHRVELLENGRRRKKVHMRDRTVLESCDFVLRVGISTSVLDKPLSFVEKSALGDISALVCFRPQMPVVGKVEKSVVVVLVDGGALLSNELRKNCIEFLSWFVAGLTNSELSLMFVGCDTIVRVSSSNEVGPALKFAAPQNKETTQEAMVRVYENFVSSSNVKVLLIGDGDGFTDLPALLNKIRSYVHKFRVFAFGIGFYIRLVLDSLVRAGQGRCELLYPREAPGSLALKAQCLARSVEQPPMAVSFDWGNLNLLLHPVAVWDRAAVFEGDVLCVLANLQQGKTLLPSGVTTVSLTTTCLGMEKAPQTVSAVVDARKYVKQDFVSLLATRCILLDQAMLPSSEQSELIEQSFSVGLAVPGITTFAAVVEDPVRSSHVSMLTVYPAVGGKLLYPRPLPNSKPFPLVVVAAVAPTAAVGVPIVTAGSAAKQRSASVLDIARAKPRAMAASATAATSLTFSDSDSDDDGESPLMQRGKSMDASPGAKKTYDMSSLLRFRQMSLDQNTSASIAIADIASMSTSPKSRGKKSRGARGGGGGSKGSSSSSVPKSPSHHDRAGSLQHMSLSPPNRVPQLVVGENAWQPKKLTANDALQKDLSTIRGILNKVTVEKMDYFIEQILAVKISTPAHLKGLIELIFERVLSAQSMTPMYAELCLKLSSKCASFSDEEGAELSFRRLLLNRCQREFEYKNREITPAGNQTVGDMIEAEFKMKRRILGNIRFVGELYRLGMLGVSIVVSCVVSLLPLDRLPDVEDLEVMCNLLTTTGAMLEKANAKSAAFVKDCFGKIQKLTTNTQLEARIRFKLQDLIDFRANGWKAVDTSLARRRPSPAQATTPKKEAVKEVVSVGGKRAASRVSQQKPSSPKPAQITSSSPVGSPVGNRQSWGSSNKDDSITSPTLSTRRRHNQADTEALAKTARELLEEYFLSYDTDEALICINELDSPGWLHRMVVISVNMACASGSLSDRKLVVKLLLKMYQGKLIDSGQLMQGFSELFEDLPSLMTDTPIASAVIGYCLASLMVAKILTSDDISGIALDTYDKEALVSVMGFFYDELVEAGKAEVYWKVDLAKIEPDAEKRKKALKKTVHACKL